LSFLSFWFLPSSLAPLTQLDLTGSLLVLCWFMFCRDGLDGGRLTDLLLFHYSFCFLHQVDYYHFSSVYTL